MQSKNTIVLAVITISIIAVAVVAGVMTQQPSQPAPQPVPQKQTVLSKEKLETMLAKEQSAIDQVLSTTYPQLSELYTVTDGKLYHDGSWYGATLLYKGSDELSRDTLRLLMQKKDNTWKIRTDPPAIILHAADYPDMPKDIIQDLNKATSLPGTEDSPAIN